MHVAFGIGNPGPEYDGTRHNLGFRVVDELLASVRGTLAPLPGPRAAGARVRLEGLPVLLVKPLTYVNRCGPVLRALVDREALPLERCLVVVDDFHLPVGRLRLRPQGSDGGHNGLKSLIESLGTEAFPRLRLGVGEPLGVPAEEYVLERFPAAERALADDLVARAAEAVRIWLRLGVERAMAEVNRRDLDPPGPRA